jgi:thiol-disulfide isomerase/thioredoxin
MIKRRDFILSLGLPAALGLFPACARDPAAKLITKMMPDMDLKTIDGKTINFAKYGKPVILHFFGLWCPTCAKDEPYWHEAILHVKKLGVEIIEVHVGKVPEEYISINDWHKKLPPEYQLTTIYDENRQFTDAVGIPGTPSILILNEKGKIIDHAWALKSSRTARIFARKVMDILKLY